MNFSTRPVERNPALSAMRADRSFLHAWARMLGVSAAAALMALSAHAQGTDVPAAAASGMAAAEAPAPRYAASDLERAFGFMDGNHDGKVSRQEAAGFRGVAKNFDRADTNQDGFLSREEFDTAMNHVKSK
jgi:hypothetical protein